MDHTDRGNKGESDATKINFSSCCSPTPFDDTATFAAESKQSAILKQAATASSTRRFCNFLQWKQQRRQQQWHMMILIRFVASILRVFGERSVVESAVEEAVELTITLLHNHAPMYDLVDLPNICIRIFLC